ncbi:alcohol acetyltransferase-domain-containing protein [Whalleya microplaca]|nr:alcohol acetyltransferase-domain-containing protein [Whalleya microplaca]
MRGSKGKVISKDSNAGFELLRKLSYNEMYQLAMYTLNQYRGTAVSCRYAIPPTLSNQDSQSALKNRFEAAIIKTILQNPVLQVGIVDADSKAPTWTRLDRLDLGNHIEWRSIESSVGIERLLQQTVASQIDTTFPQLDRQPGWRIVILRQGTIDDLEVIFTWNHPHADGTSGKIFHEALLRSLNDMGEDNPPLDGNTLILPKSAPRLPVPIEKLSTLPMDAKYVMTTLWELLKPSLFSKSLTQASWAPIQASPYKTQVRFFTVDREALDSILAKCRQHQTTLTGLLHALAALAFASHLRDTFSFQSGTPIDARRFLQAGPGFQPDRTMANYVTMMDHEFAGTVVESLRSALSEAKTLERVWSIAADVRRQIEKKLANGLKNDEICLGRFVKDWRAQMREKASKPRQLSWLVTNLGVLEGSPTPESVGEKSKSEAWSIRQSQLTLSAEVPGAAIVISAMTATNGPLCVTTNWQECLFDPSFGDQIMGHVEQWLRRIGS